MASVQPPPALVQGSLAAGAGILCAGLPRTGSMSLAAALEVLGVSHVHHMIRHMDSDDEWRRWERAARHHWPAPAGAGAEAAPPPPPWGPAEWDPWLGHFQAVTDAAGFFGPELIAAYPRARVILATRPFAAWARSVDAALLATAYGPAPALARAVLDPLVGRPHTTRGFRALVAGWLGGARDRAEARARLRRRYDEHHRRVRALVPPGQLLEYRLGDGWGPLADFLRVPVPKVPFPHVNDTSDMRTMLEKDFVRKVKQAVLVLARMLLPLLTLCLGYQLAKIDFFASAG